jgi:chromosome partitioning protein
MARIISIANQKGGVGKTTTAINLGASLAAAEKTVLVIDLDPQANATSGLGLDPDEYEYGSYDVLIGECDAQTALATSELDFLDVIPANKDLAGAEVELVHAEDRAVRLKQAMGNGFSDRYDFIIIDCPPSLGMLTLNALCAADAVIVPLQCEYYALEGLTRLLETIGMLRNQLNNNLVIDGIVLTMYDKRNNLSRQVEKEVRENFDGHVFQTIIPRNVKLSESPSFGKPAILYDVRSPGSQQYLKFAQEYLAIQ